MHNISVIVFLILLSLAFAIAMLVTGYIVAPKTNNEVKNSCYECGMPVTTNEKTLVNPRYFVYAVMFLIFDAETLLLFPFALAFEKLQFFVFSQALIFIFIILLSLGYAIQKNMLRFK